MYPQKIITGNQQQQMMAPALTTPQNNEWDANMMPFNNPIVQDLINMEPQAIYTNTPSPHIGFIPHINSGMIQDYTEGACSPAQINLQNPGIECQPSVSENWLSDNNNNINIEQQQQQQQPSLKETSNGTNGGLKCPHCPKILSAQCYYTQHIKAKHSGERPYPCNKCGKKFETQDQHQKHSKKHNDTDKTHKCPLCTRSYHHKSDLKRHNESSHTHINQNVCHICPKVFARKDHLRKHIETHKRSLI